jgi:heme A synthase
VNILYYAHSGLRYLILLAAVTALLALAYSVAGGRAMRAARNLATAFAVLLDLQILLGIGLVMGGIYPDAVTGHLMLMVASAVVTHAAFLIGQYSVSERRELGIRLAGIVVAVALIVGGIMTIGQSVLGSTPPPVGYSYERALPVHHTLRT